MDECKKEGLEPCRSLSRLSFLAVHSKVIEPIAEVVDDNAGHDGCVVDDDENAKTTKRNPHNDPIIYWIRVEISRSVVGRAGAHFENCPALNESCVKSDHESRVVGSTTMAAANNAAPKKKATTRREHSEKTAEEIMSLRRPPTRLELKSDDIEEYEQVRVFVLVFETIVVCHAYYISQTPPPTHRAPYVLDIYVLLLLQLKRERGNTPTFSLGETDESSRRGYHPRASKVTRKKAAAARIGAGGAMPRPPPSSHH